MASSLAKPNDKAKNKIKIREDTETPDFVSTHICIKRIHTTQTLDREVILRRIRQRRPKSKKVMPIKIPMILQGCHDVWKKIQLNKGNVEKDLHDVEHEMKTLPCKIDTCEALASYGNKVQAHLRVINMKIRELKGNVEKDLHDVEHEMETLPCKTHTSEALANSYGNEIQALKTNLRVCDMKIRNLEAVINCCDKEIKELRCCKDLIVFGLVLFMAYFFIFA
ncbi:predicted protein [Arabidopsis lyrata subsp. lyrata]|uniref:Predicted protein n=1 Tax=Arabidopsis lyrata subsp. lyrata TaxID=81972 RepID=D7KAW0_ARALL|nr:predicted protein [Arabidopsis lyrata subsp. lyrata]